MNKEFKDFYAIIVGINNYGESQLSSLHSAQKDATDLYDFLIKTGGYTAENTLLLINEKATKEHIKQNIECFKSRFTNNSTLLFYFSGHGSNFDKSFILPLYNFNYDNASTYFTANELVDFFAEIEVGKLLFLFDTCYAGILAREKDANQDDSKLEKNAESILEKLVETNVHNSRVLVASSLPDQTSYEINNSSINNGIFTHCLLKALQGACQIEKGSKICIFELLRYLVKNVPQVASQNNMNQHCCVKTSVLYQDFPVCYTSAELDNSTQLPKRYINAVIDLQEDSDTLLQQFADGLSMRNVDSKFTYWGQEVTKQYIELLNTNQYRMPKITSELISSNISTIVRQMDIGAKGIRVISLGIGDGYKDSIILNKICEMTNVPIDYWIIEFSYEMLKIGLKNVREKLGDNNRRIVPKLFQTDFLAIGILSDLLTDDKINLFLLLGNTLGNFPEDMLLNKISAVMHKGDYFLIDNQIKGERKLTKNERDSLYAMYDTKKYKDYIFSILNNAQIKRGDGDIKTRVTEYKDANNAILRQYNCSTVIQEFIFKTDKEVTIGGKKIPFNRGTIIPVIYSRKYTKNALCALLENHFSISKSFYRNTQYALILCQKRA